MFFILCKFNMALAHFFFTCVFKESSLSNHALRYFTIRDLLTISPSILNPSEVCLFTCVLFPNIINSDLELFIFSLTELIHSLILIIFSVSKLITFLSVA